MRFGQDQAVVSVIAADQVQVTSQAGLTFHAVHRRGRCPCQADSLAFLAALAAWNRCSASLAPATSPVARNAKRRTSYGPSQSAGGWRKPIRGTVAPAPAKWPMAIAWRAQ